jgi:hypothetical protein
MMKAKDELSTARGPAGGELIVRKRQGRTLSHSLGGERLPISDKMKPHLPDSKVMKRDGRGCLLTDSIMLG